MAIARVGKPVKIPETSLYFLFLGRCCSRPLIKGPKTAASSAISALDARGERSGSQEWCLAIAALTCGTCCPAMSVRHIGVSGHCLDWPIQGTKKTKEQ